jgi:hypothetical protein
MGGTRRTRLALLVGSGLVIGALVGGSTGVAAAQSRAAHRWNHVAAGPQAQAAVRAGDRAWRPWKVIRLNEVFTDAFTFVDVGEPGESPGDYGVFRDPVSNPRTGRVLGTVDVQCIAAYADQCRGSITLDGRGQITFDGITPLNVDPDKFAITGGTGEFVGAGGELVVSFPSDTFALLTVRLRRP